MKYPKPKDFDFTMIKKETERKSEKFLLDQNLRQSEQESPGEYFLKFKQLVLYFVLIPTKKSFSLLLIL